MKKQEIRKEWEKVISESIKNKPNIEGVYPSDIVKNRELLLFGQVELGKIEAGNNLKFHTPLYRIIVKNYFRQKQCLRI